MSSRRREIVEVATGLFAKRGYASTSMRDLAEASDLLAGSLYSHFRSKAHLLELVILPFYGELIPGQQAALSGDGSGAERTEAMLRSVIATCAAHADVLTILHYDWATLAEVDELADVVARSNETLDLWEQVLDAGRADGSLRSTISTPTAVRIITSSIHGVLDRRRFGTREDPPSGDDVTLLADEVVASLIGGLSTSAAPR
jgi:AcrR family transcriptional regulator